MLIWIFFTRIGSQRQIQGRGGCEKQPLPEQEETRTGGIRFEERYRGSRAKSAKVRTRQSDERSPDQESKR